MPDIFIDGKNMGYVPMEGGKLRDGRNVTLDASALNPNRIGRHSLGVAIEGLAPTRVDLRGENGSTKLPKDVILGVRLTSKDGVHLPSRARGGQRLHSVRNGWIGA